MFPASDRVEGPHGINPHTCLVDVAMEIRNLYGRHKVLSSFVVFIGTLFILLQLSLLVSEPRE